MTFKIKFLSLCLAMLFLAVPFLTACDGEEPSTTGGTTTETPTTEKKETLLERSAMGAVWKEFVKNSSDEVVGIYVKSQVPADVNQVIYSSSSHMSVVPAVDVGAAMPILQDLERYVLEEIPMPEEEDHPGIRAILLLPKVSDESPTYIEIQLFETYMAIKHMPSGESQCYLMSISMDTAIQQLDALLNPISTQ